MADKSVIEWTDATWNVVTGCAKVSAGCKHCYAERDWARLSANPKTSYHRRAFTDVRCHSDRLNWPLNWRRPRLIFVPSMGDLFHERVPFEFIATVFGVMAMAQRHTFQVFTKRPERLLAFMRWLENDADGPVTGAVRHTRDHLGLAYYAFADDACSQPWPLPNVWLGVSAEDQATADERIPYLLQTPAAVRFLSAEPLLAPIDLEHVKVGNGNACVPMSHDANGDEHAHPGLDWVIVGGESGPRARSTHPDWVRALRDECMAARVAFFFKQWGAWWPCPSGKSLSSKVERRNIGGGWHAYCVGKKAAGRLLDGRMWDERPVTCDDRREVGADG